MPDGLYERDILEWSEQQAGLLRRLAAGERLNEAVDWTNLIEEIETVGRSELHACRSLLRQALVHLLKLRAEPEPLAAPHWRGELVSFLADARDRYSPSMRQQVELAGLYHAAVRQVRAENGKARAEPPCPFTLDDLLSDEPDVEQLVAKLR